MKINGDDPLAHHEQKRVTALDWSDLATKGEPPERRWAIQGWLGFNHVTLLVGAGGIGKTLISQQLASCLALGKPSFIGEFHYARTCLMWACEDEHDELWRRQVKIAKWQNVGLEEYAGQLVIEPRAGMENCLLTTEFGKPMFTPLIEELTQQAGDYQADVVILDNVGQLYGANENDRHSVTMFINALTGALPGRAILLLAHPSRGLNSEFSGSSAWENCARTRLYLTDKLPEGSIEDSEPNGDTRFLCRRKANYSSKDYRTFQFSDGVLVEESTELGPPGAIDAIRRQKPHRVIIDAARKLKAKDIRFTDGITSPDFLPKLILNYKLGEGCTRAELADAMRQAVMDGKLTKGIIGQYGNRSAKEGLILAEDKNESQ